MRPFDLLQQQAERAAARVAIRHKSHALDYRALLDRVNHASQQLSELGVTKGDRVALYLQKNIDLVVYLLAANALGAVFVPINPLLKIPQLNHILRDTQAKLLVTHSQRVDINEADIGLVFLVDTQSIKQKTYDQSSLTSPDDLSCLLYTSGSTGLPKGVMLSDRNLIAGAEAVTQYLNNSSDDVLLSVLPLSFDYGLNQLISSLLVGAELVLFDYLLPCDIIKAIDTYKVTGVAGVPPIWQQLTRCDWTESVQQHLRYITNSGGHLAEPVQQILQEALPTTDIILMYGLTEAFRSTYLPADLRHAHPDSMGIAIPGATLRVMDAQGHDCADNQAGELIHAGDTVALGYWNHTDLTKQRFGSDNDGVRYVRSGDTVKRSADGLFTFIGRDDEMMKVSGYRISPQEIELPALVLKGIEQAVCFNAGENIILLYQGNVSTDELKQHLAHELPNYMQPSFIEQHPSLPLSANGKLDRALAKSQYPLR